jgi:hypothetical protein
MTKNKILKSDLIFRIIFISLFLRFEAQAQISFGGNLFLNYSKKQQFPGLRLFVSASFKKEVSKNFQLIYAPSISVYTNTIGSNLNPSASDYQIDFSNTIMAGLVSSNVSCTTKSLRTLHNADYYNLYNDRDHGVFLGTNFILNNHQRNQIVASGIVNVNNFSILYYNDGPDVLGLGDKFDRYWTGGLGIYYANNKGFNNIELSFDQFTGYQPLIYELSNILGFDVPQYSSKKEKFNFNTSTYHLKVGFDNDLSLDFGVIGSLRSQNKHFGLQDIIHMGRKMPIHPNDDNNRFYVGFSYLKNLNL